MILLPELELSGLNPDQIVETSGAVFQRIFEIQGKERAWSIFEFRYGFFSNEQLTFEQLGEHFDVSRQRIHQIHTANLLYIRQVLFNNKETPGIQLKPEWLSLIQQIYDLIVTFAHKPCLENTIMQQLKEKLGITKWNPIFLFMYDLQGIRRLSPGANLGVICGIFSDKNEQDRILKIVEMIDQILTKQTALPLSEIELLSRLIKGRVGRGLTSAGAKDFAQLCSSVETLSDGKIQGKFELLSHPNKFERILCEEGRPLRSSEMFKRISQRLVIAGLPVPGRLNAIYTLSKDSRFVPIGKTGWKLASWTNIDSSLVIDLMIRSLQAAGKPQTSKEIFQYVSTMRTTTQPSIEMYLVTRPDQFKKMGYKKWGLNEWKSDSNNKTWDRMEVAEFVEQFFRNRKISQVKYQDLRAAMEVETNLSAKKVTGLLRWNPAIKFFNSASGDLMVEFQTDYRGKPSTGPNTAGRLKKITMEQKMLYSINEFLRTRPGKEADLHVLISHLGDIYKKPYRTIHTYLGRMQKKGQIDRFGSGKNVKFRLKAILSQDKFPTIQQIHSITRQEQVLRAFDLLTPDQVDMGLLQLGKTFESTLKAYIKKGLELGKFTGTSLSLSRIDNWKLVSMVDFIHAEGIIVDSGEFHYLRQERNDRAHGNVPDAKELSVIWAGAPVTTEMYIRAICMLDNYLAQFERESS